MLDPKEEARLWIDKFVEKIIQCSTINTNSITKALLVVVLTKDTSDYLAVHDPMALKQAHEALEQYFGWN